MASPATLLFHPAWNGDVVSRAEIDTVLCPECHGLLVWVRAHNPGLTQAAYYTNCCGRSWELQSRMLHVVDVTAVPAPETQTARPADSV